MSASYSLTPLPIIIYSTLSNTASAPTPYFREEPKEDEMTFYQFYCPCSFCASPPRPANRGISMQSIGAAVVPRLELPSTSANELPPLRRSPYNKLPPILPGVTILQAQSSRPRYLPVAPLPSDRALLPWSSLNTAMTTISNSRFL
ncbi:hypothetical protein BDF22DRAFT_739266 [Syncephalis plumigaleata]|nr:hypothetical protein BDF22DRAFT_739266 [Syncephalis plumigaleata]